MTGKIIIIAIVVILLVSALVFLTSCKAERYKVICTEGLFINVKGSYKAGQTVRVYFPMVATDTDYTFYLDGERIHSSGYSDLKGYTIEFTMPAHDVELTFDSKNSMIYTPASEGLEPGTPLFGYVNSVSTAMGNESYEISVTATDIEHSHLMTVYNEDGSKQAYLIPVFPYESVVNYAQTTDLASWNELEDYECIDGKKISVSILCDGEYINISTDQMPEGGEHILAYLKSHFTDYMTEDYLTQ
ncbi:MAG: hypothetical protein IJB24_03460 [Clostridia bacterium]|nr:hypothetical protein [Clostridia bacterium]